jgi:DHA2 family multidrug resistance protein-like MFS transporter
MTVTVADGLPVPQRYWAILTIALGLIMAVMDGAIANVALPTIAQDLHASPAFSIWIVNGYQLAITISLLPLASLGEIIRLSPGLSGGVAVVHACLAVLRAVPYAGQC